MYNHLLKTNIIRCCCIITALIIVVTCLPISAFATVALPKAPPSKPNYINVSRAGNHALKLQWGKVSDADGYEIYRYNKISKTWKKVKTIKNIKTVKWTNKKLKSNAKYTYKIRSYKKSSQGKVYSKFSYKVSAVPYTKSYAKVNAGKIKPAKATYEIGIGEAVKITGKALPSSAAKKQGKKVLSEKTRLWIVPSGYVKKKGSNKVVGRTFGKADVYLMAHNGYKKRVNVQVVDFAKPKKWINLDEVDSYPRQFIKDYKKDIAETASYFSTHWPEDGGHLYLDKETGEIVNSDGLDISGIETALENIIIDSPYLISVHVYYKGAVEFNIFYGPYTHYVLSYSSHVDYSEKELEGSGWSKVASHWRFRMMPPGV
jgi:hypothetical protein